MALRARQQIAIPTSKPPPAAWDALVPEGATGAVFGSPVWHHLFAGQSGASEELFIVSGGEGVLALLGVSVLAIMTLLQRRHERI